MNILKHMYWPVSIYFTHFVNILILLSVTISDSTGQGNLSSKTMHDDSMIRVLKQIALNMNTIPGGVYQMGCSDTEKESCYYDQVPLHEVNITAFRLSKFEVTRIQWENIMGSRPNRNENCDNCPVTGVSWVDVHHFIDKINKLSGRNYRLPTEEEWEYAAKGGEKFIYAGSNSIDSVAWYQLNSNYKTHPVGLKKSNGFGLYDMSGNVWEWTSDWYKGYPGNEIEDYTNSQIVMRGGAYDALALDCTTIYRTAFQANQEALIHLGFRLAEDSN